MGCPTMSAVPPTNRSRPQDDRGPAEQLLEYTEQILELEARLRFARLLRRFAGFCMIALPTIIIGLYIATDLTYRKVNLRAVWWPMAFVLAGMVATLVLLDKAHATMTMVVHDLVIGAFILLALMIGLSTVYRKDYA